MKPRSEQISYIPGSSVYLVWSQGREGDDNFGEPDFGHDMNALFDIHPRNIFFSEVYLQIEFIKIFPVTESN